MLNLEFNKGTFKDSIMKSDNLPQENYLTDYEPIFNELKNSKNQDNKVVRRILFKKKFLIVLSVILCFLKLSPALILPLITSAIIDSVVASDPNCITKILYYTVISVVFIWNARLSLILVSSCSTNSNSFWI